MKTHDPNFQFKSERDKLFAKLWLDGISAVEIGKTLKIGKTAVYNSRVRLGLPAAQKKTKVKPPRIDKPPVVKAKPSAQNPFGNAPVTFFDVAPNGCKWPVNDHKPFLFCNCPRDVKSPYCNYHKTMAALK